MNRSLSHFHAALVLAGALAWSSLSPAADCNRNRVDDASDIAGGTSTDCNANGVPDECDLLSIRSFPSGGEREPWLIEPADLNGDGRTDLAVMIRSEDTFQISIFMAREDGSFEEPMAIRLAADIRGIVLVDFDQDGDIDILAVIPEKILALMNSGDGKNYTRREMDYPGEMFSTPIAGDFDGDGDLDLFLNESSTRVFFNQGDGSFSASWQTFTNPANRDFREAGDFDGDRSLDVVNNSYLLINSGDGTFRDPVHHGLEITHRGRAAIGDYDRDGDLELALARDGAVVFVENSGRGKFLPRKEPIADGGKWLVSAGDFDGDSDLDLLVNHREILLNDGAGNFSQPIEIPFSLARLAADVQGDGAQDIIGLDGPSITVLPMPFFLDLARCLGSPRAPFIERCPYPRVDELNHLPWGYLVESDELSLSIESASGATGDVVGVTVSLRSTLVDPEWLGMGLQITVCHDPEVAEIAGSPIFSDDFLSILGPLGVRFHSIDETAGTLPNQRGHGFHLYAGIQNGAYKLRFPSEDPMAILTVYYRLKGKPGDSSPLRFCDYTLRFGNTFCAFNHIHAYTPDHYPGRDYQPAARSEGALTVRDGPPTRTEPPLPPPEATVYPELPPPEAVDFRVRITGASALPGSREVPVQVFIRAAVEYTGIQIPVDFDERYLRLARAEDHFISGWTLVNNRSERPGSDPEEGNVLVFSAFQIGNQRIAAEGEEFHAATLYFDVLEAASEVSETALDVVPIQGETGILYRPWITVRHRSGGITGAYQEARSEVEPIAIVRGAIAIRPPLRAQRGDANLDGRLDVTDPIAILEHLFLGSGELPCPGAADADRDESLAITDPIHLLGALFLGEPPIDSLLEETPCY